MGKARPEIEQWLVERGYPADAIQKILERLDSFDAKANRDSVFDAMGRGELDMDALIKEVLGEP